MESDRREDQIKMSHEFGFCYINLRGCDNARIKVVEEKGAKDKDLFVFIRRWG